MVAMPIQCYWKQVLLKWCCNSPGLVKHSTGGSWSWEPWGTSTLKMSSQPPSDSCVLVWSCTGTFQISLSTYVVPTSPVDHTYTHIMKNKVCNGHLKGPEQRQFPLTRYDCENSKLQGNWCRSWCTQSSHWRNTGHRSLESTFPTACPHRSANLWPKSSHSRSHSTWKPCNKVSVCCHPLTEGNETFSNFDSLW